MIKVTALVVIYYPDLTHLSALISNLLQQTFHVVVVDNTPDCNDTDIYASYGAKVTYLPQGQNLGIAEAHNIGIQWVSSQSNSDFVLLMDQDSLPDESMVDILLSEYNELAEQNIQVAAVGPVTIDSRTGSFEPFTFCTASSVESRMPSEESCHKLIECDFLISSGSLIPLDVLRHVGLMESELFIDCVDIEWGFRARHLQYRLFGVGRAKMYHAIGDLRLNYLGRSAIIHSPVRHYYFYRNLYVLAGRNYVPTVWKLQTVGRSFKLPLLLLVFSSDRFKHLSMIGRGVFDGLRRRLGSYGP